MRWTVVVFLVFGMLGCATVEKKKIKRKTVVKTRTVENTAARDALIKSLREQ